MSFIDAYLLDTLSSVKCERMYIRYKTEQFVLVGAEPQSMCLSVSIFK